MRPKSRGMTLLEALITCSVVLIALNLTSVLFQYGTRTTEASKERTDVLESRVLLSERLREALANGHRSGNSYIYLTESAPNPDLAVALLTAEDESGMKHWNDATQQPIYQGYIIFFRDKSTDTIQTKYHSITPNQTPKPLKESELRTAISSAPSKTLVSNVSEFCLFSAADNSVALTEANPIGLRWIVQMKRGNTVVNQMTFKFVNT